MIPLFHAFLRPSIRNFVSMKTLILSNYVVLQLFILIKPILFRYLSPNQKISDRADSVAEVNRNLSRGAELKDDALLMMEPYNNWEDKLMPASYAVAILGQLIVILSISYFQLTALQYGFKYVQWPNSFRSSLFQIGAEGHEGFKLAHKVID